MKKLFAALLAVLMVFGCVPCITAAETANTLDEFDTALNAAGGSLDFTQTMKPTRGCSARMQTAPRTVLFAAILRA